MTAKHHHFERLALAGVLLSSGSLAGNGPETGGVAATPTKPSPWAFKVSLSAKESFDSNVYLQDEPYGATGLAEKESFVTTVTPSLGFTYAPAASIKIDLNYAPDIAFYHSESSEDHLAHRATLGLSGKLDTVVWTVNNSLLVIDGSDLGLVWDGPGGAPAAGGIAVRNRRDALVYVAGANAKVPLSRFFVRPSFSYYLHDFQTRQLNLPGYLNYVDRDDIQGGFDLGAEVAGQTFVTLGYRLGHQDQDALAWSPMEYSNDYQRLLVGLEGQPWTWLKLSAMAGPDFRHYGPNVAATYPSSDTVLYADATLTLIPTPLDQLTFKAKQYQQPGFGGRSIYNDKTFSVQWRRRLDPGWTVGAGFQAYNTDFIESADRDDWIFTPSALVSRKFNRSLSAEVSYTYDWTHSAVSGTPAREFTRHIFNLGVRYTFL